MTGAEYFLYDDPAFFARYQEMREREAGLNEDLEQPAITRLLPDVTGTDVLDIGCGDGTLARWLAAARLGHADPAITLRVYAHIIRAAETAAADVFARVISEAA
jgi:SAM-dependent methyltransferase